MMFHYICKECLANHEPRPHTPSAEVRTADELLSIMREVINDDLLIQSLHRVIHEKLKIHDVTIGEEVEIRKDERERVLDDVVKSFVKVNQMVGCPYLGNEPYDCDANICGRCILEVVTKSLRGSSEVKME